jgi:hypothetical protein
MSANNFSRLCQSVFLVFCASCNVYAQSPNSTSAAPLDLRVVVSTPVVALGDSVFVRVELKNKGHDEIPIARWLVPIVNGPAYLVLEFENENGSKFSGENMRGMFSTEATNDWWTMLAPYHYYGVEIDFNYKTYSFLKAPGKYRITARYVSKGGLTPPSRDDWHIPGRQAWQGDISSKAASFEVLPTEGNRRPPGN